MYMSLIMDPAAKAVVRISISILPFSFCCTATSYGRVYRALLTYQMQDSLEDKSFWRFSGSMEISFCLF